MWIEKARSVANRKEEASRRKEMVAFDAIKKELGKQKKIAPSCDEYKEKSGSKNGRRCKKPMKRKKTKTPIQAREEAEKFKGSKEIPRAKRQGDRQKPIGKGKE